MTKVVVQNIMSPGSVTNLDAGKYEAMKQAVLKVLPAAAPGITVAEMQRGVLAHLPDSLFPDGAKAGWWGKAVQLDLEAKGVIAREKTKPLRLHRVGAS
ncbi:MAG: hypothetical protein H7X93_13585 [Sphingomonadaceae bacterium]|nr:hypothetical protein [Sphingomonadaceae bacterium]